MNLDTLRKKIDKIDEKILLLLKKRFDIVKEITKIKKLKGLKIYQPEREKEIFKKISEKAEELGMDIKGVKLIYKIILKLSKNIQRSKNL
jgi:chorismate mutase